MSRQLIIGLAMVVIAPLWGQAKRDARMVGMGGAYTTVADGIYAIGVNPANLAFQADKPFMLGLGSLDFGLVNNYFSLENWWGLSGVSLERNDEEKKIQFYRQIGDGLRLTADTHLSLPALNYASGTMALTSDLVVVTDFNIPKDLFRFILDGNPIGRPLDVMLNLESIALAEYAFSFAVPYEKVAWGVSLKYLLGLVYLGIDTTESFSDITTDTTAFYGGGRYFIRQGVGGSGVGLDLGFTTKEIQGWRAGISLINAAGTIRWNRPNFVKDMLGVSDSTGIIIYDGEEVTDGSAMLYEFTIDSLNGLNFSQVDMDSIFQSEQGVVKDTSASGEARRFTIRYPALLRLGVSKQVDPDFLIASDLVAGFEDRLHVRRKWKWSIGMRFTRFPSFPLRLGFTWGGATYKEMGMGVGFRKGPLLFDFALGFRNGVWFHNMQGISLSMSAAFTGFGSRFE